MRFIILLLVSFLVSCTEQNTKPFYVAEQTPKKIASYQVQEGSQTLGYAHKYQWESKEGDFQYHYFIYNRLGEMIGYVGETGRTEVYSPLGETKYLGEYTLEEAASKIFETRGSIRILSVQADDVKETKNIVISSQGDSFSPSRGKSSKTKILKDYNNENQEQTSKIEEGENKEKIESEGETQEKKTQEEKWPGSEEKWPGED